MNDIKSIARDDAIEILAKELYWKMEHLYPTEDGGWSDLEDDDREVYRQCVKSLLVHPQEILQGLNLSHDDLIKWST